MLADFECCEDVSLLRLHLNLGHHYICSLDVVNLQVLQLYQPRMNNNPVVNTNATYQLRYGDAYFKFFAVGDGHPARFGQAVVDLIPRNVRARAAWILDFKGRLETWNDTLRRTVHPIFKEDMEEKCRPAPVVWNSQIRSPKDVELVIHEKCQRTARAPWHDDLNTQWTYTLDFDHEVL